MFAGGSLHWLAIKNPANCSEIVMGFDLGLGQFHKVPFPTINGTFVNFNSRSVVSFDGSYLCILDKYPNSHIDGWLMNGNGAENLWYKAFSVVQHGALGSFRFLRPVAFSKSLKEVLLEVDGAKLVWYDLERKTVKNINIHGMPIKFNSHLCIESLIPLTKDKEPQRPSQDKKQKEQKRCDRNCGSSEHLWRFTYIRITFSLL
ncbi:F-box protein CPR1-like [Apium graveolens]|uniref:F-box protein CPR1-like n=1 Tax=Apium graveolens TaxID=4045 RepID=UPI003D7BAFB3